jgi:hypothetical protein
VVATIAVAGRARNNPPQVAQQEVTSEAPTPPSSPPPAEPPKPPEGNRAFEITRALIMLQPKLTSTMGKSAIGVVTREGTSLIGTNNNKIYAALLEHTESGAIPLRPGEYLCSPPVRSGKIPHPDWDSPFVHAETLAEYEMDNIFDLKGPGQAWSVPMGCGFCVPHLYHKGIIHMNPNPSAPTQ